MAAAAPSSHEASSKPPRPPPEEEDQDEDEDDEEGLGTIGFMFDGEARKSWVTHRPGPGFTVDVQCIDEDGPGALISGQYVWPAAPFLAGFVARHWGHRHPALDGLPPHTRVLELGAGCGLVGLTVAQMAGCATVVMTDHDPGTLRLIEAGVARNQARLRAACRAALLEWGQDAVGQALVGGDGGGGDEDCGGFDLVIGSDLIYSDTVVRPLLATVAGVLGDSRGKGAMGARFLICGSFALGEVIMEEVVRVCAELKLVRTVVSLEGEGAPDTVWMECLTLA